MSNTAPSRADPVVVFPLGRWCPPQETSQPHPPRGRRQAIIWTNTGIFLIGPLIGNIFHWNLNRNLYIFIQENAFENDLWKMATICLGLNVLNVYFSTTIQWLISQVFSDENALRRTLWTSLWYINISSGDGSLPDSTKPLHEPMLAKFYDTIWYHWATMSVFIYFLNFQCTIHKSPVESWNGHDDCCSGIYTFQITVIAIIMTSHECHGISTHQQLNCFNTVLYWPHRDWWTPLTKCQ